MKLNMDDPNVFETEMTVEQARKLLDEQLPDDLSLKLDEAQGHVHAGEAQHSYLVITITR